MKTTNEFIAQQCDQSGEIVMLEAAIALPVEPTAQPIKELNFEQTRAVKEAQCIAAIEAYFRARPQLDSLDRVKVFQAGFSRGYDAATPPPVAGDARANYDELIYAVGEKWPGESRHETALRYIRQAETRDSGVPSAAIAAGGKP